ncbi:MAG TPA: sigma-70 family RNA polymerase sigma factor [Anaeromyxobacter sp.]|nr:sigma-70 family RNA polymerase sigma factor [Anaeromyxobacter sp.]
MNGGELPLADHLFRHQAGRMVASLARALGPRHLALAEDAVQDALVRALETWRFGALPRNPAAWLMRCARNRALDMVRRQGAFGRAAEALGRALEAQAPDEAQEPAELPTFPDDELRLMFSCCAAELPPAAQVAVILKYLCGFSVHEIAQAFLSTEAAVEKQLYRARTALEVLGALYDVGDPGQVRARLPSVHEAIYLLFNEGYHGAHPREPVRQDLCAEALRLCQLLEMLPDAGGPDTQALLSLLCFHAARLGGRTADDGSLLLLAEQDRARWDHALVAEGFRRLGASAQGWNLTPWHLEAAIAAQHALAGSFEATDWPAIRTLYDRLLAARPSPVVALNRAIALGMAEGPDAGLSALAGIPDRERLARYPFLPAAVAEFERRAGRTARAAEALRQALALARSPAEEAVLARKLSACQP